MSRPRLNPALLYEVDGLLDALVALLVLLLQLLALLLALLLPFLTFRVLLLLPSLGLAFLLLADLLLHLLERLVQFFGGDGALAVLLDALRERRLYRPQRLLLLLGQLILLLGLADEREPGDGDGAQRRVTCAAAACHKGHREHEQQQRNGKQGRSELLSSLEAQHRVAAGLPYKSLQSFHLFLVLMVNKNGCSRVFPHFTLISPPMAFRLRPADFAAGTTTDCFLAPSTAMMSER